jgi:tRNA (guanine-N7-)-methyltransferase
VVRRVRQHVNPLQAHFGQFRGDRPTLVAGDRVEVEIGCADAQFLFERARQDPTRKYVGLEIREPLVQRVNSDARKEKLPVHAVFCQAQMHMEQIFSAHSVERVYVNFPDPWFKVRHRERRMVDARLARGIHAVARPGAEVFFQSDVWDIALDALAVFENLDDLFCNQAGEWTFWKQGNPFGVRSWREQNAEETGLPIWRILYRCRGPGEE